MVKFHLFVDSLKIFIFEKDSTSRVMALKGAHIEYVVVKYYEGLLTGLRVGGNFIHVFEFHVEFGHSVQLLFIIE